MKIRPFPSQRHHFFKLVHRYQTQFDFLFTMPMFQLAKLRPSRVLNLQARVSLNYLFI